MLGNPAPPPRGSSLQISLDTPGAGPSRQPSPTPCSPPPLPDPLLGEDDEDADRELCMSRYMVRVAGADVSSEATKGVHRPGALCRGKLDVMGSSTRARVLSDRKYSTDPQASAELLTSLASYLTTFQDNLGEVSGQIADLQARSDEIERQLKGRRVRLIQSHSPLTAGHSSAAERTPLRPDHSHLPRPHHPRYGAERQPVHVAAGDRRARGQDDGSEGARLQGQGRARARRRHRGSGAQGTPRAPAVPAHADPAAPLSVQGPEHEPRGYADILTAEIPAVLRVPPPPEPAARQAGRARLRQCRAIIFRNRDEAVRARAGHHTHARARQARPHRHGQR